MSSITTLLSPSHNQPKKQEEQEEVHYLKRSIIAFFVLIVIAWIWPWALEPFTFFSVWSIKGSVFTWLLAASPILIWAAVTSLLCSTKNKPGIVPGTLISAWAGIVEEICFRWLIFLHVMVGIKVLNFLFFDWLLGFGLAELFHNYISGPIVNWTTFGYLEGYIFHPHHWAIGAGMLIANGLFRDGHTYQGLIGIVNSWFIGLFFFYMMFSYGLLAAILVHFLYDLIILVLIPEGKDLLSSLKKS